MELYLLELLAEVANWLAVLDIAAAAVAAATAVWMSTEAHWASDQWSPL